jgi:hypothetical protein
MRQPQETNENPPTEEEIISVTQDTILQLNLMAARLEAYVGEARRNPETRTRRDDQ